MREKKDESNLTGNTPLDGTPPKGNLLGFLSHPVVVVLGLFGSVASLIGIPLAFYLSAKEYPKLTYYVNPAKAVVVKAGQASRLTTSYDNKVIDTDITAAQVQLWNSGGESIKRESVLRPVVIYTDNNTPILEATIRKARREVTRLALNTEEAQQGRVTVLWDILEQTDGGAIQLIYAGSTSVPIRVDGVIEGQPQIAEYNSEEWSNGSWARFFLLIAFTLLMAASLLRQAKALNKESFHSYLKAHESLIENYDSTIETYRDLLSSSDKRMADFQERTKSYQDDYLKPVLESTSKYIEGFKQSKQEYEKLIERHESEKKQEIAKNDRKHQKFHKEERRFDLSLLGALLLMLLTLIPAIYFIFIAQPVGPPFGF